MQVSWTCMCLKGHAMGNEVLTFYKFDSGFSQLLDWKQYRQTRTTKWHVDRQQRENTSGKNGLFSVRPEHSLGLHQGQTIFWLILTPRIYFPKFSMCDNHWILQNIVHTTLIFLLAKLSDRPMISISIVTFSSNECMFTALMCNL